MPTKKDDQHFEDAVKPALESLLSDLQRTTEVLRRGGQRKGGDDLELEPAAGDNYSELRLRTTMGSTAGGGGGKAGEKSQFSPARQQLSELSEQKQQLNGGGGGELSSRRDPMLEGDKLGIHTIPKGDCPQCGQAVIGPVVIALGRMWHPDHFCCAHCGDPIGHRNFFERQGKAYCETDYHDMFSPRCNYCNGPIKERCVTALGKTYHVEHFVCSQCGRQFGDEGFHERSNTAHCRDCFYRQFAPKCNGCKQPITHKFITALNTHWHPECFCCQDCARPFGSSSLFDRQGRLLCEMCFHGRQGSICAHCQMPIAGRCVFALGRKFHPEHFVCCYCTQQIGKGSFKEFNGRAFCIRCYRPTTFSPASARWPSTSTMRSNWKSNEQRMATAYNQKIDLPDPTNPMVPASNPASNFRLSIKFVAQSSPPSLPQSPGHFALLLAECNKLPLGQQVTFFSSFPCLPPSG